MHPLSAWLLVATSIVPNTINEGAQLTLWIDSTVCKWQWQALSEPISKPFTRASLLAVCCGTIAAPCPGSMALPTNHRQSFPIAQRSHACPTRGGLFSRHASHESPWIPAAEEEIVSQRPLGYQHSRVYLTGLYGVLNRFTNMVILIIHDTIHKYERGIHYAIHNNIMQYIIW